MPRKENHQADSLPYGHVYTATYLLCAPSRENHQPGSLPFGHVCSGMLPTLQLS